MKYLLVVLLLLFLASPLLCQEDPPPVEEEKQEEIKSPLVAAGWCVINGDRKEEYRNVSVNVDDDNEDDEEAEDKDLNESLGCDMGLGLSLHRIHRLAFVVVIGAKSVGMGLAWVVSESGPSIAIAFGIIAEYNDRGIYTGSLYPALGATLSFGGD